MNDVLSAKGTFDVEMLTMILMLEHISEFILQLENSFPRLKKSSILVTFVFPSGAQ